MYFGILIVINHNMPTNRSKISTNKTLLILLGILLACLLTLNARSFYSADSLSFPKSTSISGPTDKNVTDFIDKIGVTSIRNFIKKVSSLK